MAVTEETLRIVFEVKNEAEAKAIEAQLGRTGETVKKVADEADKATKSTANFGRTALESGRILQDFAQGGLGGVLNNIEGFTMAIGLGPGAAGALTALGLAAYFAGPALKELAAKFVPVDEKAQDLKGTIKALEERIDELNKKEVKVPIDTFELDLAQRKLNTLKEGLAAWEAARAGKSTAEKESGQAVAETLAESKEGESAVVDKVTAARLKAATEGSLALAEKHKQMLFHEAMLATATKYEAVTIQEWLKKDREEAATIRANLETETKARVGIMLKEAKEGAVNRQKELAGALRESGQADLAVGVEMASPEEMVAKKKAAQAVERQKKLADLDEDLKKKAAAAEKARVAEAEKQGREAAASPGAKEQDAIARRKGMIDPLGRRFGQEGFDVAGARAEARKALHEAEAQKGIHKLKDVPTLAQRAKGREAFAEEQLARGIYRQAGGQFSPDMAREAAKKSMEMQKKGLGAVHATNLAMGEVHSAFAALAAQVNQAQAEAAGLGRAFRDQANGIRANQRSRLNRGP